MTSLCKMFCFSNSFGFLTHYLLNIDIDEALCDSVFKCFLLYFNLIVLSQNLQ